MRKSKIVELEQTQAGNGNGHAPQFGSKRDVARMLQFSTRTVDNMLRQGCPHMKFGPRRTRFDLPEVASWFKEHYGTQRRGPESKPVNA